MDKKERGGEIPLIDKNPKCPMCGKPQFTSYKIRCVNGDMVIWFHCICGTIFHNHKLKDCFNEEYKKNWGEIKGAKERSEYIMKVYAPLVEDMTYGRKFLDIGFTQPFAIKFMEERGWISTGVDIIKNDYIVQDFMEFDFNDKFDFIHIGHVIESVDDIDAVIKKAKKYTAQDGCVLITTPSPEILFLTGIKDFGHFPKWYEKKTLPSKIAMEKLAIKHGFTPVLYRQNLEKRYMVWNDAHYLWSNE